MGPQKQGWMCGAVRDTTTKENRVLGNFQLLLAKIVTINLKCKKKHADTK